MKPGALLICRADANMNIGTGHVMRCMALADAWAKCGGEAVLLGECDSALRNRAAKSFSSVQILFNSTDSDAEKQAIRDICRSRTLTAVWIVLDGYRFDSDYQRAVSELGYPVLVIDDYAHLDYYAADVILNQNAGAEHFNYQTKNSARLLLGTEYVLMRGDLLQKRKTEKEQTEGEHILITMGGVDAPNLTQRVLEALAQMKRDKTSIRVLMGSANPHICSVKDYAESALPEAEIVIQSDSMAEQYYWATAAISAAGTTSWELCYFGVPSMLIQIADNQQALAEHLGKTGAVINLGWHERLSAGRLAQLVEAFLMEKEKHSKMSGIARALVDGKGAERVIREMRRLLSSKNQLSKLSKLTK
ncbi:UDP-2,4-diacetamido-2,4,6-trideoxy-beta-L-altropyranose hydrolase [bacterium]|nr:UDP-2,4-diacetamido-2,4,6-trideoxy-beta-L-altropyranose hydrolase [bacterium]